MPGAGDRHCGANGRSRCSTHAKPSACEDRLNALEQPSLGTMHSEKQDAAPHEIADETGVGLARA
jgi:hypothetical protein